MLPSPQRSEYKKRHETYVLHVMLSWGISKHLSGTQHINTTSHASRYTMVYCMHNKRKSICTYVLPILNFGDFNQGHFRNAFLTNCLLYSCKRLQRYENFSIQNALFYLLFLYYVYFTDNMCNKWYYYFIFTLQR